MSKRAGAIVTLDDLLDDIGVDAARWFLASRSHDTTLDLDLELARSQSQDNPVYYVQYAHARIASILRKAGEERVEQALAADLRASAEQLPPVGARAREAAARAARRGARGGGAPRAAPDHHLRAQRRPRTSRPSTATAAWSARPRRAATRTCGMAIAVLTKRVLAQVARPARGRGAGADVEWRRAPGARVARWSLSLVCRRARGGGRPLRPDEGPAGRRARRSTTASACSSSARAGARQVLVLVPGTKGGAGGITPVARDIVAARPAHAGVDRRPPRAGVRGHLGIRGAATRTPRSDYYLGFKYRRVAGEDAKFVGRLGPASCSSRDLRSVVRRARAGGRRVILGGHSAGASTAVAYAAWDFGGAPGLPRDRRARADRRRPARAASPRPTSRARSASWPTSAAARCSSTCSASASPRSTASSPRSGRSGPTSAPTSPRCSSGIPLLPDFVQADVPRHERGAVRLRVRRDHVARMRSS